jgi:hypothetical protein
MDETSALALAEAVGYALQVRSYGHPAIHAPVIRRLAEALRIRFADNPGGTIDRDTYEKLRGDAVGAAFHSEDAGREVDRVLIGNAYTLLLPAGDSGALRLSTRADLAQTALLPGSDVVMGNETDIMRRLAHLHAVAFPEILPMLKVFTPPGARVAALDAFVDNFVFCRKINSVLRSYIRTELEEFGIIRGRDDDRRVLVWAPVPAIAFWLIEKYLDLSGGRVDFPVGVVDLRRQFGFVLPDRLFDLRAFRQQLGLPDGLLREEVGGSRLRLTAEGLIWFARRGLVDPITAMRALKAATAHAALRSLCASLQRSERLKDAANRGEVLVHCS